MIDHDLDCLKMGLAAVQRPGALGADPALVFCGRCEIYGIAESAAYMKCVVTHEMTSTTGFNVIFTEQNGTRHEVVWYRTGEWMLAPCDCGRKLFEPKGQNSNQ